MAFKQINIVTNALKKNARFCNESLRNFNQISSLTNAWRENVRICNEFFVMHHFYVSLETLTY